MDQDVKMPKLVLIRMSVGSEDSPFETVDDALNFLNNDMPGRKYGFGRNKPQEIEEDDMATFTFGREIYGESRIKKVIREEEHVTNAVFERFSPYDNPVMIAVKGDQEGYKLPHYPGQQYGYYDFKVLADIRKIGAGGTTVRGRPLSAKDACKIGRESEICAMEYEKNVRRCKVRDRSSDYVGYDFESLSPNGNKRYVEVKTEGLHVELTPNELSAARRFGREYFLYVIGDGTVHIIKDPGSLDYDAKTALSVRYVPCSWSRCGSIEKYACP